MMMSLETKIRDWYMGVRPDDDLGAALDGGITFRDLYDALICGLDIYEIIGVGDSIIREYLFDALARILGEDYMTIYRLWLHRGEVA